MLQSYSARVIGVKEIHEVYWVKVSSLFFLNTENKQPCSYTHKIQAGFFPLIQIMINSITHLHKSFYIKSLDGH